jgi:hypothetical protein
MEAEVSFYGVGGKEEFSVAVQDHQEAIQSLYNTPFKKFMSKYLLYESHHVKN